MKQIGMLKLYNRDYSLFLTKVEKNFLLIAAEDRSQDHIFESLMHYRNWSNLSFCLLFRICLCLSNYLFSLFSFVPRQLNSLFLLLFRALSLILVAKRDSSVCYSLYCQICAYTFVDHVSSPKLTVFYSFNRLCFA